MRAAVIAALALASGAEDTEETRPTYYEHLWPKPVSEIHS